MSVNPQQEMDPLVVGLISLRSPRQVAHLTPITVPDTYLGMSQEFHPEGLYSNDIFGLKGTNERMENISYINLNADIIVPDVFKQLKKARSLYIDIMRGSAFAKFDKSIGDFVPAPIEEGGKTGYSFFIQHLPELQPQETGSSTRSRLVKFIEKYRMKLTTRYLIVMAAGYRDLEQGSDGRMQSDEVNNMYLGAMRGASFIQNDSPSFDNFRYQTQIALNNIAEYVDTIIYGKNGQINSKFAKRGVRQGTRNVITAQVHDIMDLDDPANLGMLDSTVGLIQTISMYPDKILFNIKQMVTMAMPDIGYDFEVIDPNTHKSKSVPFDADIYNLLTSASGLEQLIKILKVRENRLRVITSKGMWLGALYKPPGKVQYVTAIHEIDNYKPEYLHPVTITELVYLAIVQMREPLVGTSTRPPVLGKGGIGQGVFVPYFTDPYELREDITTGGLGPRYPSVKYSYLSATGESYGDGNYYDAIEHTVGTGGVGSHNSLGDSSNGDGSNDVWSITGVDDRSRGLQSHGRQRKGLLGKKVTGTSVLTKSQESVATSINEQRLKLTDKPFYGNQAVELVGVWNDSFTISELRDKALGADRDGDALSALPITTTEAMDEIKESLLQAETYRSPTGKLLYGLWDVAIANNVIMTLTGK